MIIRHPLKTILIKTKKVGGTSVKINLPRLCDEHNIAPPIPPQDETLRASNGRKTAQNGSNAVLTGKASKGWGTSATFDNHISAKSALIIPIIFGENYRKIVILRNLFDVAIAQYFRREGSSPSLDFLKFLEENRALLNQNRKVASLHEDANQGFYLRFENLAEKISSLEVIDLLETFQALRSQSDTCPRRIASTVEFYDAHPDTLKLTADDRKAQVGAIGNSPPWPPKRKNTLCPI